MHAETQRKQDVMAARRVAKKARKDGRRKARIDAGDAVLAARQAYRETLAAAPDTALPPEEFVEATTAHDLACLRARTVLRDAEAHYESICKQFPSGKVQ